MYPTSPHCVRARLARSLVISVSMLLVGASSATAAEPTDRSVDVTIAGEARALAAREVSSADITDTEKGRAALENEDRAVDGLDINRRPHRVYAFGEQVLIVDAKSPLQVFEGKNAEGKVVYEINPLVLPAPTTGSAGFAVTPPDSYFLYNTDGDGSEIVGTWKRTWFYILNKANNYKACGTCTAYDYWRVTGKMRAATLTGAKDDEGFKRAWLEFDRSNTGWTTVIENDFPDPTDSYGGNGTTTTTIGFATGLSVELGKAPLVAGGTLDTSYQGSMTKNTENWHPISRAEDASGGVQWCRYEFWEFTGTRTIATRMHARIASDGTMGGWYILRGMQDDDNACPSQI